MFAIVPQEISLHGILMLATLLQNLQIRCSIAVCSVIRAHEVMEDLE